MQALYDEDIVEEEVLIDWDSKVSKKYVSKEMSADIHGRAAPFIKWLKEAEEESSDEVESEDDDVEVLLTKNKNNQFYIWHLLKGNLHFHTD